MRPAPAAEDVLPVAAHGHASLAAFLVLSQWAVGLALAGVMVPATALAAAAAVASTTHLGRPLLAWRAVLGWRHSWLSREVLAMGAFVGATTAAAALTFTGGPATVITAARFAAGAGGVLVVGCSALVYAVTGRAWWSWPRLVALFGSTVAGAAAIAADAPVAVVGAVVAAKVLVELEVLRHAGRPSGELSRTARLLTGQLGTDLGRRLIVAVLGVALWSAAPLPAAAILLGGDLLERGLRFRAISPERMP